MKLPGLGLRLLALLSITRWQNILVLAFAQYLAAVYVFLPDLPVLDVLLDPYLHLLVICGSLTIAGGYMVNSFYDVEKDLVNRPAQTAFERILERPLLLQLYLLVNFLAVVLAAFISTRAVLFYAFYGLGLWLYSHKLKKVTLVGNLAAAAMAMTPFFALFVYYREFPFPVTFYLTGVYFLLVSREVIKDAEAWKGDVIFGYPTIPVRFGRGAMIFAVLLFNLLAWTSGLGWAGGFWLQLIWALEGVVLAVTFFLAYRAKEKEEFARLNTVYKLLLLVMILGMAGFSAPI